MLVAKDNTIFDKSFPISRLLSFDEKFMELSIGDKVYINSAIPYLKTTDPMPMLRPPDLVSIDEIGIVVGLRAMGLVEVRFRRGTFLFSVENLSLQSD